MDRIGATVSLVVAFFLLVGMLLDVDTRLMGVLGIAGVVMLVGVYEILRKPASRR